MEEESALIFQSLLELILQPLEFMLEDRIVRIIVKATAAAAADANIAEAPHLITTDVDHLLRTTVIVTEIVLHITEIAIADVTKPMEAIGYG